MAQFTKKQIERQEVIIVKRENFTTAQIMTEAFKNHYYKQLREQAIKELQEMPTIEELKKGTFFKRNETAKEVYSKDGYNRSLKKYTATAESDFCKEIFLKKGTKVFINFEY